MGAKVRGEPLAAPYPGFQQLKCACDELGWQPFAVNFEDGSADEILQRQGRAAVTADAIQTPSIRPRLHEKGPAFVAPARTAFTINLSCVVVSPPCYRSAVSSAGYLLLESASINAACPNGKVTEGGEITMKMRSQVPEVKVQPAGITPVPVESIA